MSASITILVEAADALMASAVADRIVAGVRRTVEEASSEQIATTIEGRAEVVPELAELGSTVASRATSEAALQVAVGIVVDVQFRSGKAEVLVTCLRRH